MTDARTVPDSMFRRLVVRLSWVALLIVIDAVSKRMVFAWLDLHQSELVFDGHGLARYPLLGNWLALMESRNGGIAWGVRLPWFVLIGGRVIASAFLVYLVAHTPRGKPALVIALVLILAGALGNLYDNLFMPRPDGWPLGEVRDFIDVYFGGSLDWHFPTFNVADSCITIGAVFLFASGVFGSESKKPADAA